MVSVMVNELPAQVREIYHPGGVFIPLFEISVEPVGVFFHCSVPVVSDGYGVGAAFFQADLQGSAGHVFCLCTSLMIFYDNFIYAIYFFAGYYRTITSFPFGEFRRPFRLPKLQPGERGGHFVVFQDCLLLFNGITGSSHKGAYISCLCGDAQECYDESCQNHKLFHYFFHVFLLSFCTVFVLISK